MSVEKLPLTDYQEGLRQAEKAWLDVNSSMLGEISRVEHDEHGRGVLLVNTQFNNEEKGHPYWYLQQSVVEEMGDDALIQAVRKYDPINEFVLSIIVEADGARIYTIPFDKSDGALNE